MKDAALLTVRVLAGGMLVVAFAMLSDTLKPKMFAGLFFFVTKCVQEKEREPWLWGGALAAVSPVAVVLSRKLWNVCLLPPFTVVGPV